MSNDNVECDVIAHGLLSMYANQVPTLITVLNHKLQCNLNNATLKSITALNKSPNQPTCTYKLTFHHKDHKQDFMSAVNGFRLRVTEKRQNKSIKLEDIFDQYRGTFGGLTISFKNAMTKNQREIYSLALEGKRQGKIEHVWERDEKIWLRKKTGERAVEASSVEIVKKLIAAS